jgi:hypothetical protein
MKKYEWVVIGSGIAGIITSEILSREGHKTILIEKNEKLASETTRDFHEWMHVGSLFTLIPDNLKTLKFILGAIDDLFDFYSSYKRMNLLPTEDGLDINGDVNGWFIKNNFINFKFRVQGRKIVFPWLIGIARSIFLIQKIQEHDWLRRRAGIINPFKYKWKEILYILKQILLHKDKFYAVKTPDFTMNSRALLRDMVATSIDKGLVISTSNKFIKYEKTNGGYFVVTEKETFFSKNIALCSGGNIANFVDAHVKKSYAPMAVVDNVSNETKSFVELDYYPKNCINIITKDKNIGLVGGISFNDENKCDRYIEEVIKKHKIYQPNLKVLKKYNGVKCEFIIKGEPRNYLYHIKEIENNVWMVIPGKFTLGFSIGPEFYRKVYNKNPKRHFSTTTNNTKANNLVTNTVWQDAINNNNIQKGNNYGND